MSRYHMAVGPEAVNASVLFAAYAQIKGGETAFPPFFLGSFRGTAASRNPSVSHRPDASGQGASHPGLVGRRGFGTARHSLLGPIHPLRRAALALTLVGGLALGLALAAGV